MKFMLDTNACIDILKENENVLLKFRENYNDNFYISCITLAELEYGVKKSKYYELNRKKLFSLLKLINILPFDENAALHFGAVYSDLEKKGCIIGKFDMLIGAHALSCNMNLITNNTDEFNRINGLTIQDWRS